MAPKSVKLLSSKLREKIKEAFSIATAQFDSVVPILELGLILKMIGVVSPQLIIKNY